MGTVRLSLQDMGTLKKLDARGTNSEAMEVATEFRTVMRGLLEGGSLWRPTVTPTLSGAEMLMTRPPAVDQETFDAVLADAVEHFRSTSPSSPLFVS